MQFDMTKIGILAASVCAILTVVFTFWIKSNNAGTKILYSFIDFFKEEILSQLKKITGVLGSQSGKLDFIMDKADSNHKRLGRMEVHFGERMSEHELNFVNSLGKISEKHSQAINDLFKEVRSVNSKLDKLRCTPE